MVLIFPWLMQVALAGCIHQFIVKNVTRSLNTLLFFVLGLAFLQTVRAEGYLYLFKKSFPGDFAAVEAIQEEKMEGNLKLTTADGKLSVWQEDMLAAKFPLFDEATEKADLAALQTSIEAMEKFITEEPGSKMHLQGLIHQRQEYLARLQSKTVENSQVATEALNRYLADIYSLEKKYSLDYLEAKVKRGEQFKQLLPDQAEKIAVYVQPWTEELQNRNEGRIRFEGQWLSEDAVVQVEKTRSEAARKIFFEKELFFEVPGEAVPEKIVYLALGLLGVSALVLLLLFFTGLSNVFQGFGLGAVLSVLFGLGGLGAYAYGAWILFEKPPGFVQAPATEQVKKSTPETITVEEFIFQVHQLEENKQFNAPSRFLLEDAGLNAFLGKVLKVGSSAKPGAYAVTRKGLKVRVLVDRILIFDEFNWFNKDVVVCYSFFFSNSRDGFQFFKTEAHAGGLPLPGRAFKYLWEQQIQPVVSSILGKSKVLEYYHVSRMESGTVELISNRNPPKPAGS